MLYSFCIAHNLCNSFRLNHSFTIGRYIPGFNVCHRVERAEVLEEKYIGLVDLSCKPPLRKMLQLVGEGYYKRDFFLNMYGFRYVNQIIESKVSVRFKKVLTNIRWPSSSPDDRGVNTCKLSELSLQQLRIFVVKVAE